MKKLLVTGNPKNLIIQVPDVELVSSKEYLTNPAYAKLSNVRVFNLANEYRYQSKGYYVSLLAEARGHKVVPDVKSIQDLKVPAVVRIASEALDDLIQRSLRDLKSDAFVLSVYFGQNVASKYQKLAQEFHRLFQAPLMRARFLRTKKKWQLVGLRAIAFREIPEHHLAMVQQAAEAYFSRKRFHQPKASAHSYDLAILVDPAEKAPPSNKKALQLFVDAAESQGFNTEMITEEDYHRIGEFDALFIRETTNVNQSSYRFARRAQSEGIAVIDAPDSILRCANKVYLAELIQGARLAAPKTLVVHADNVDQVISALGLPVVLKLPDTAFSLGVKKAKSAEELETVLADMLRQSDLVVAQAFMPSDFDWRIGVLDGSFLFACKYYMARDHWQIYNWGAKKQDVEGNADTLPEEEVPPNVLDLALRICSLIGDGLYGVDIKELDGQAYIIEVNDNPNIDAGVEDLVTGKALYERVIQALRQRIIKKHTPHG